MGKSVPAEMPQSAKDAERTRFLKSRAKRKATRAALKKINTAKVTAPRPLKKAKKVK